MKSTRVVTFGEVMMRLSTPVFARFGQTDTFNTVYGGSEANVAVSLSNFSVPTVHITRFPDNDFGQAATRALRSFGVDTRHIIYGKERMGIYFLENGTGHRASRIIYDRFDSAFSFVKPGMIDWGTVFKGASWFHWGGITPAISQGAADVCLEAIKVAHKMGLTVSGDINYRRNLWQYGKTALEVMPSLIELTHVIAAGQADLLNCAGVEGDSFQSASRNFMSMFSGVTKVATVEREIINASHNKIRGILWNGKELQGSHQYDIAHIVDRVGAGDAFMAGLFLGEISGKSSRETLEFATAACSLKHTVEGDVNRVTLLEVEALASGQNIGKLLR